MTRKRSEPDDGFVNERTLPANLEAERSILGAILLHPEGFDRATPVVAARDFFRDAHKRIFASMCRLTERHAAIDFVTLKDDLGRHSELDDVGGPAYITALVDGVPRSTNIEHYAQVVKEKATLRGLITAAGKILSDAYEAADPAADQLARADKLLVDLQAGHEGGRMVDLRASSRRLLVDLEQRVAHKGELIGLDTGFTSINDLTFGWQAGDMIVIAARPSIGKTTFALNSALAGAKAGKRVAVFSLEMRHAQLEYRALSHLSGVPLTRVLSGYVPDAAWNPLSTAMLLMENLNVHIDDRAGQSAWDIRTACRRLKAEGGLDLVVIDYVQLMPGALERRGATRNEEVTDISRRIKALAGDYNVPVLLLSQLNRAADARSDPRPKLSDLRDSGALEQDADLVCFLHRKNHRESGVTQFIMEKQRNGPTGTVNLTIDRDTTTFTDGGEEPAQAPPEDAPKQAGMFKRRAHSR